MVNVCEGLTLHPPMHPLNSREEMQPITTDEKPSFAPLNRMSIRCLLSSDAIREVVQACRAISIQQSPELSRDAHHNSRELSKSSFRMRSAHLFRYGNRRTEHEPSCRFWIDEPAGDRSVSPSEQRPELACSRLPASGQTPPRSIPARCPPPRLRTPCWATDTAGPPAIRCFHTASESTPTGVAAR